MGVSENNGTRKSSILIGLSIINHPFWGTPIFGTPHILVYWSYICLCFFFPLWEGHFGLATPETPQFPVKRESIPAGLWNRESQKLEAIRILQSPDMNWMSFNTQSPLNHPVSIPKNQFVFSGFSTGVFSFFWFLGISVFNNTDFPHPISRVVSADRSYHSPRKWLKWQQICSTTRLRWPLMCLCWRFALDFRFESCGWMSRRFQDSRIYIYIHTGCIYIYIYTFMTMYRFKISLFFGWKF